MRKPHSAEGDTQYVKANKYSAADQLSASATEKDRMVVLTSVSRALTAKLGCADKAHLPTQVPDGKPLLS